MECSSQKVPGSQSPPSSGLGPFSFLRVPLPQQVEDVASTGHIHVASTGHTHDP